MPDLPRGNYRTPGRGIFKWPEPPPTSRTAARTRPWAQGQSWRSLRRPPGSCGGEGWCRGEAGQNFSPGKGGGPFCRARVRGVPQSFLAPSWARGQLGCKQCLLDPATLLESYHPPDLLGLGRPLRSPHSWASAALWHTYLACCGLTVALLCPHHPLRPPLGQRLSPRVPRSPALEQR